MSVGIDNNKCNAARVLFVLSSYPVLVRTRKLAACFEQSKTWGWRSKKLIWIPINLYYILFTRSLAVYHVCTPLYTFQSRQTTSRHGIICVRDTPVDVTDPSLKLHIIIIVYTNSINIRNTNSRHMINVATLGDYTAR